MGGVEGGEANGAEGPGGVSRNDDRRFDGMRYGMGEGGITISLACIAGIPVVVAFE